MRVLLDTHCWLWWLTESSRLSEAARGLMQNGENVLYLSAASSWEIAVKFALGKLPLPEPPEAFVPKRLARDRITPLAVEHVHALRVSALPLHHRDPFDRLLVAQAQVEEMPILTVDPAFSMYDVEVLKG